jgi:transcriptional regulator with XRE-family HTH domain
VIRLTAIRTKIGMSKASLARAARIDQGQMSKIESGRVVPYPGELARLAEALHWPVDDAEELLEALKTEGEGP